MSGRDRLIRFAHRGASALAPENTMAAFQTAVDLDCDWIETDLRVTADGIPVLVHDATLTRTTGLEREVGDLTLSRIRRLDAGSWFDHRFRGETVPTLDEVLEWSRGRCGLNLEIKEEDRVGDLLEQTARRVRAQDAQDQVLFSSFRSRDLVRLRRLLPKARMAWLISRTARGLRKLAREVTLSALHPKAPLANRRLVNRCHVLGISVHVWVVNQRARLDALEAMGTDGIMTDDPRIFFPENPPKGPKRS